MIESGFIKILNDDGVANTLERIDLLSDWWIPRGMYERLFVYYLECLANGDELIKLDIHIPTDLLDTIGTEIIIDEEEQLH